MSAPADTKIESFTARPSRHSGRTPVFAVNATSTSTKFRVLRDEEVLPSSGRIEMVSRLAMDEATWSRWNTFLESSFAGQTVASVRSYFSYEYDVLFRVPVTLPPDAPLEPGDTEEE